MILVVFGSVCLQLNWTSTRRTCRTSQCCKRAAGKKNEKLCYSSPVHFTCLEINRLVVDKKRVNAWLEKQSVTRLCFAFKSSLARWNGWKFSQVQCPWFALKFIRQSPNIVTTRSQASARSPEPQIGHYEGRGLLNEHADRCSRHFAT